MARCLRCGCVLATHSEAMGSAYCVPCHPRLEAQQETPSRYCPTGAHDLSVAANRGTGGRCRPCLRLAQRRAMSAKRAGERGAA